MSTIVNLYDIHHSMIEYQKNNNIKQECIVNTVYLYDMTKSNSTHKVKVVAMCVFGYDDKGNPAITAGHLVLLLDDKKIIDPSYDVFRLNRKVYYHNLKNLFDELNINKSNINMKKLLSDHISFIKFANQINNGTFELRCADLNDNHYYKQADYIENMYSKYLKPIK
jgi:hypothetical protein